MARGRTEHSSADAVGQGGSTQEEIMTAYLPIALLGVLSLAASAMAQPMAQEGAPASQLSDAQAFSAVAGKIVGAASACETISRDRIAAATKKAASITSSVATSDDELSGAAALFTDGADAGKAAVRSGQTNCTAVEHSLANLEQIDDEEDE
jgi:hypothetical protein